MCLAPEFAMVGLVLRVPSKPWILFSLSRLLEVMRVICGDIFPAAFLNVSFLTTLQNPSFISSSLTSFPGAVYKQLFKFCLWEENQ